MKQIPFYPNADDNMQCMVSIYRILFEHYLGRRMSQKQVADLVGYEDDRAVWTVKPLVYMARLGFDIRMVEGFDYRRYQKEGEAYLDDYFAPEPKAWQLAHTNLLDIKPQIPAFLRTINLETRTPTLADIDSMLAEGRLVFVTVNSRVLNGKSGYVSHAILVIQGDNQNYTIHDPGLPPKPYRVVARERLLEAMSSGSEVTGFLYRKSNEAKRLDSYVVAQKPRLSRAFAAKLIEQGRVLVDGKSKKPGYKVKPDDIVTIDHDDSELDAIPYINLPIVYEDDDCLVINKPGGILTHAQGHMVTEATVATFLRDYTKDMNGERAGVVHRLDRATSGLLICAKHPAALQFLQKQFAARSVTKTYTAVVTGKLEPKQAVVDMPIERNPKAPATFRVGPKGKPSVTAYKVLKTNEKYSLVELTPKTGRTHQLRVHMQKLGHPIVGDPLYGGGTYGDRLFLHAGTLHITIPNGQAKTFTAPLPKEFAELLA